MNNKFLNITDANKPFIIVTVSIFIVLLAPILVQNGMFLDGVTYSAISSNMADGIGSFWKPHYTKTLYPNFQEHPALFFIIESFFYKLLGNGLYTERIFTFLTAVVTALCMLLCWNTILKNKNMRWYGWIIILFWITIPIVFWSYRSNMIENVLSIFTLLSVYFIYRALNENKIFLLIPGAIFIVLAFLTKGPVGLFPLAVPLFYILAFNNYKCWKPWIKWISLIIITAGLYWVLIILFPGIKSNIEGYLQQQLVPALNNKREITVSSRFSMLVKLLSELALPLLVALIICCIAIFRKRKIDFVFKREFLFVIMTALSASLPLMITLKQRRYYLIPSLALFILAFGLFIVPLIKPYFAKFTIMQITWFKRISYLFFTLVIVYTVSCIGKYSRDELLVNDVYTISASIPEGTILSTSKETWNDWSLHAYMSRIGRLSLDCDNEQEYYLIQKNTEIDQQLSERYAAVDLKLNGYIILKRKNN